jgi:putative ABC transport system permease protein
MFEAIRLAWLTIVRQPTRSCLGIIGVAAVGALLFDMLLLSRGLVLSFRDLLDRAGFDIRVVASDAPPFAGPRIANATAVTSALASLPQVETVLQLRLRNAEIVQPQGNADVQRRRIEFIGADPRVRPSWTILEGRDLPVDANASRPLLVNRNVARNAGASLGSPLTLRGRCGAEATLPPVTFTIVGIAEFPFDNASATTVAGRIGDVGALCGDGDNDRAELLLVRSAPGAGADVAAAAIRAARPDLYVATNEELVERFSRVEFSYFRQISVVLATVTLFFGFLLIAVLLTVSVNQRLGEIAALRAVGFSRSRVVAGVLCESVMLVGAGGILAVPLGTALSVWLDGILRALPEIPADVHFFVFEPRALGLHVLLLGVAALAAALYPMRIVAVLPIAATLRREVVS